MAGASSGDRTAQVARCQVATTTLKLCACVSSRRQLHLRLGKGLSTARFGTMRCAKLRRRNIVRAPRRETRLVECLFRRWAPEFFEALVTAAVITVKLIAQRILDVIVLVIVFGRIKLFCRDNLGNDGLFKTFA